jgi:hypothetical protein
MMLYRAWSNAMQGDKQFLKENVGTCASKAPSGLPAQTGGQRTGSRAERGAAARGLEGAARDYRKIEHLQPKEYGNYQIPPVMCAPGLGRPPLHGRDKQFGRGFTKQGHRGKGAASSDGQVHVTNRSRAARGAVLTAAGGRGLHAAGEPVLPCVSGQGGRAGRELADGRRARRPASSPHPIRQGPAQPSRHGQSVSPASSSGKVLA